MDPRDRITELASPICSQPRYSVLPPLEVGRQRYILGASGVYLEARSRAVRACIHVGAARTLPFGEVIPELVIGSNEHIPRALIEDARRLAEAVLPNEWAGKIVLDRTGFRLLVPRVLDASPSSISYSTQGFDPLDVVMDIHSHGTMSAFFSRKDNRDDRANPSPVFIAAVIGGLGAGGYELATRVMVMGRTYDLNLAPMPCADLDEPKFEHHRATPVSVS